MGRVLLGKTNRHPLLGSDIEIKDFKAIGDAELHNYYKDHGGTLSREKYKSLKKLIFIKFMEYVLFKGRRMDIPYFGELFVQETKVPARESKNSIVMNGHYIAELLLQRYSHTRTPMNFYQDMELTLKVDSRIEDAYTNKRVNRRKPVPFTKPYKDKVQLSAAKAKRIDKDVKFVKSFKKHEDYVYPDD